MISCQEKNVCDDGLFLVSPVIVTQTGSKMISQTEHKDDKKEVVSSHVAHIQPTYYTSEVNLITCHVLFVTKLLRNSYNIKTIV